MFDLYLVTDEKACLSRNFFEIIKQAVEGGVTMVQLREKELDTRHFLERAIELKKMLSIYNVPLIINDRIDIALAIEADGVHIGQNDMPFESVKKIITDNMIVGLSVETIEQVKLAEKLNIDYLGISPIFSTPTKTDFDLNPWGLSGLKKVKEISKHKLIAIGGINETNAAEVIQAGADGIAVVSAICSSVNPKYAAVKLLEIVKSSKSEL